MPMSHSAPVLANDSTVGPTPSAKGLGALPPLLESRGGGSKGEPSFDEAAVATVVGEADEEGAAALGEVEATTALFRRVGEGEDASAPLFDAEGRTLVLALALAARRGVTGRPMGGRDVVEAAAPFVGVAVRRGLADEAPPRVRPALLPPPAVFVAVRVRGLAPRGVLADSGGRARGVDTELSALGVPFTGVRRAPARRAGTGDEAPTADPSRSLVPIEEAEAERLGTEETIALAERFVAATLRARDDAESVRSTAPAATADAEADLLRRAADGEAAVVPVDRPATRGTAP